MTATERITELVYRNLQEVFGEGDPARRHAAIEEFYTDDCALYVPDGVLVGHDALDKFAGELTCDSSPFCLHTPWRAAGSTQRGNTGMGLGPER